MEVMRIEIGQSAKAFRVNGVTVAKRHLQKTLGKDCGEDNDKMLAKYLCIVPFLDQAFTVHPESSESVKYGAYKAHRLYKALGINEDNTVPFMLMCLAQAGNISIPDLGGELRAGGFYGEETKSSFHLGERPSATIIPFPGNQTRH